MEEVRPYLGSHAGGVEYLGLDADGVARLRLEGSCHGCPSSTVTVRMAIERAILEAAPEVARVEVEGMLEEPAPALLQIGPLRGDSGGSGAQDGGWRALDGLGATPPGAVRAVVVDDLSIVVCSARGSLYAYRRCARRLPPRRDTTGGTAARPAGPAWRTGGSRT